MKKVKVIKKYTDKVTRELHQVDEELSLTNERTEELIAAGRVVIIDDEGKEVKEESVAKDMSAETHIKQDKTAKQTKEEKQAKVADTK